MLWDLAEGKRLYSLDAGDIIYALTFSPNRYWLCAATQTCIKIWCAASICSSCFACTMAMTCWLVYLGSFMRCVMGASARKGSAASAAACSIHCKTCRGLDSS